MFPDGAMPIVPVVAGPRSDKISPKRLDPTTTLNLSGFKTKCAHKMSIWYLFHSTSVYSFDIASTRSSQYGIVIEIPFDLVADVRCFLGLFLASSNANRKTRSTPILDITVS